MKDVTKKQNEMDLLEGLALMGGLATVLEVAAFVGDLLDGMSEGARHELVDAFAATRPGQAYSRAVGKLNQHREGFDTHIEKGD